MNRQFCDHKKLMCKTVNYVRFSRTTMYLIFIIYKILQEMRILILSWHDLVVKIIIIYEMNLRNLRWRNNVSLYKLLETCLRIKFWHQQMLRTIWPFQDALKPLPWDVKVFFPVSLQQSSRSHLLQASPWCSIVGTTLAVPFTLI